METEDTVGVDDPKLVGSSNAVDQTDADSKVSPARKALVEKWLDKITQRYKDMGKTWKRMDSCMRIVKTGTSEPGWGDDNYVAPVLARHINQSVAQLYAKNPTVVAKRKPRLLFKIWDGKPETASAAMDAFATGDPSQLPLLQDLIQGQQYIMLMDKIGKTLEVLWAYYLDEQEADYKEQLKAMVRRSKTNGIAYVKLGFQRVLELNKEVDASISDITKKIAVTERLLAGMAEGETLDPDSPDVEQLKLNLADLQNDQYMIVREGPVLSFPKSKSLIVDPQCTHLKTFAGARWVAELLGDFDIETVKEIYKVDLTGRGYTQYKTNGKIGKNKDGATRCRLWQLWDRENRQSSVLCEGYCDFLDGPASPETDIERFYPYFPLILNEVESDEEEIPPSDVWMARHPQDEINRARQGLREHRVANRPYHVVRKGALTEQDKTKFEGRASHALVELEGLGPGDDVEKLLTRGPVVDIDEKQYDVSPHFEDILRTVGAQEANLGPTTGHTATETSISENSRMAANADHVDELDSLLTKLARTGSQLMLLELSKETVEEIAGPGAAWPEMAATRSEIVKDLYLDIEAGSSGRPNEAAELAKFERASTTLLQLPGINPMPMAKKYLRLLNVDVEEGYVEGLPSIAAINQLLTKSLMAPPTGDPNAPQAQGPQGAANAPQPAQGAPQGQPAFPAPTGGVAPATGSSAQNLGT